LYFLLLLSFPFALTFSLFPFTTLFRSYDDKMFLSGFLFNLLLAYLLTFLGIHLGIDLYLAAAFAFGVRLFQNVAAIRRLLLTKRSEEHTSELQSRFDIVCRLLLEKKNT